MDEMIVEHDDDNDTTILGTTLLTSRESDDAIQHTVIPLHDDDCSTTEDEMELRPESNWANLEYSQTCFNYNELSEGERVSVDKEVVQKYVTFLSMMSKHHEPIAESLDFLQEMIKSNCNGGGELYTQTSKIIEDIMERLKYSNTLENVMISMIKY